jgi:hypothetical protein
VQRLRHLGLHDWQRTAIHDEYNSYSVLAMFRHLALHDILPRVSHRGTGAEKGLATTAGVSGLPLDSAVSALDRPFSVRVP